jgi:hypothetical protein
MIEEESSMDDSVGLQNCKCGSLAVVSLTKSDEDFVVVDKAYLCRNCFNTESLVSVFGEVK